MGTPIAPPVASPTAGESCRQWIAAQYGRLRELAHRERRRYAVRGTTSLAHDAAVRLMKAPNAHDWQDEHHNLASAIAAIRSVAIDCCRRRVLERRVALPADAEAQVTREDERLLRLDGALRELAASDPLAARLVELRWIAGLSLSDAAERLGVAPRTANRMWDCARGCLTRILERDE